MKNLPLLLGTLLGTVALVFAVAFAFSKMSSSATAEADPAVLYDSVRNVKGQQTDPKVTIVEFSDLHCPSCRAAAPLVTSIGEQYKDQVKIVYRHFPLVSIHANAQMAAQAAEAAAEQGKFWELHDLLFAKQDEWASLSAADFEKKLAEYADELKIDKTKFLETIQSDSIKTKVGQDVAAATKLGVNATPTFYVNGQKTAAPQLQTTVESLLQ